MPPRRRNRYEFEHANEEPLPSGMPLPVVNANVFHPPPLGTASLHGGGLGTATLSGGGLGTAPFIQHIDNQNNRMLEQALKASLENHGLQEAKEESMLTAGDELFNQVLEQLPYLKPAARHTLHLITGLDDIISHEKNQESPSNVVELQRIQQNLQKALDTGEPPPDEDTNAAASFIAGYDVSTIKGAVFPRLESELVRLQIEEVDAEAEEMKQTEDEQIRQALEESIIEDALLKAKAEKQAEEEQQAKVLAAMTTGGGAPIPQTPAERRAARLAALDRLEAAAKAAKNP